MAFKKQLDHALECLTKEDPSLRVHYDEDTGETILSGMGELHLDIIQDRIRKEYKVDVHLGKLQIAYKEAIQSSVEESFNLDTMVGDTQHRVSVTLSVHPTTDHHGTLEIAPHPDSTLAQHHHQLHRSRMSALKNGVASAMCRGMALSCTPRLSYNIAIHLQDQFSNAR
jgi:elongation factor G